MGARAKLTALSSFALGLAHFYEMPHRSNFAEGPDVEVVGAGDARMNGWYHRREADEGTPEWLQLIGGRRWFEKDDGSYIYWNAQHKQWRCCDGVPGNLQLCYLAKSS